MSPTTVSNPIFVVSFCMTIKQETGNRKRETAAIPFTLKTDLVPQGDQPEAIEALVRGVRQGLPWQTLLGVTGSGKTFTMANVIQQLQRPTLILSHNKTLAAQLYGEFRGYFPDNAVEYFISYYDYYQPEAYVPSSDVYIEKETEVNDEIDRLRLKATASLLSRRDVLIVASVSCIYGLGSPEEFATQYLQVDLGQKITREEIVRHLVDIYYSRNNLDLARGEFRVRGDVIEIHPAYEHEIYRVQLDEDVVEKIRRIDPVTGEVLSELPVLVVFPAKHFVTTPATMKEALGRINKELDERIAEYKISNKFIEAQRIEQRTKFDIEMLREVGFCSGIENYSRHLSLREAGMRPACLLDYFPDDMLVFIDESHVTLPQLRAMYNGDRKRKETLVDYGFRLPSALDNRPLRFDEWDTIVRQGIFVSATPTDYELTKSEGVVVEQVVRPTGLLDPIIQLRPTQHQIDDLMGEIQVVVLRGERVLVTTLTKRSSEDLTTFLRNNGIRVEYLHSEIESLKRIDIIRDLRLGQFDVLVGVNLLREGLDLPEVALIAILDADKEGFLRSERSLMQTAGRAARNSAGKVIFYADTVTESMRKVIEETNRRRAKQEQYNSERGIIPTTIRKSVEDILIGVRSATDRIDSPDKTKLAKNELSEWEREELIERLEAEMEASARKLEFEHAAALRDRILLLRGESIDVLGIQPDEKGLTKRGKQGTSKRVNLVGETRKRIEKGNRKREK